MSVDVSARIVYGFILSHDEYEEYYNRMDAQGMETSDFCFHINSYITDSDVVYGVIVESTDYSEPISKINGYDVDQWERCLADWKADFPDRANDIPEYFLVCRWW